MLKGHGNDGYRYDREVWADFSTNVGYGPEPKGLKERLWEQWNAINSYPEVIGESLAGKIAQHHQLNPEQVLVANGTTESIYLLAQLYAGKRTTLLYPSFSEYEDACSNYDHQLTLVPWPAIHEEVCLEADLVIICNPNNPTGQTLPQLKAWISKNPNTLFAIDEAFVAFTLLKESVVGWMSRYPNILVMRSMTKAYSIPGLRLGYMLGQVDMMDKLRDKKQPWTVNVFALAAGTFIFDHFNEVQPPVQQLLAHKEHFVHQLEALGFIDVYQSSTHYFLCKTRLGDATELKDFLMKHYGLLIRDASNFRGLGTRHFRIATLHPDQNGLLINALKEWKKQYS